MSLRNNVPPTIRSNTPSWYFLQYHKRYSLQYATHATHISTLPTLAALPHQHVTHADMSPTLTQHHHKHTTNSSRSPTQACHLRYPRQHNQHAISQTPGHPVKDFKCLSSEIPRGNLAVFTFSFYFYTASTFQVFLSILIEVWKTAIEKFRGNQSALFKTELFFQKQI